jgi:single-strand DNA-binding protein
MYALKNRVQLIGRLGSKPELKEMANGKRRVSFSIVTVETYHNAQGYRITERQSHRLIAWGKVAEIALRFLDKGIEIAIEGKLVNRHYSDKEGQRRIITEIQINELLLLGSRIPVEA